MAHRVEHGFELFRDEELLVGYEYARNKDKVSLSISRLREIMNDAGKTRLNAEDTKDPLTPRNAIKRALKAFERKYRGIKIPEAEYEAFVHAGAKMFSERNLNTKAVRQRQREEAEKLNDAAYGIEDSPEIDPTVNRQLALNLTGHPLENA